MSRILVSGSTDGLGRAAVEKLLADGHAVIVHARRTERAETLDLSPKSPQYAEASTKDYAERTKPMIEVWQRVNGKQVGDSAKLVGALIELAALDDLLACLAAGVDADTTTEQRADELLELSASLTFDVGAS
jgi:NAD(P)-dependent dehydrogenase (short-subunit alcohol dehydrogenase family)